MKALIVGADNLGRIPDALALHGIEIVRHITGRNASHQRKLGSLPSDADLVLLFTDFLGHNVMRHYRELAHAERVPVVASKRSVCSLTRALSTQLAA